MAGDGGTWTVGDEQATRPGAAPLAATLAIVTKDGAGSSPAPGSPRAAATERERLPEDPSTRPSAPSMRSVRRTDGVMTAFPTLSAAEVRPGISRAPVRFPRSFR